QRVRARPRRPGGARLPCRRRAARGVPRSGGRDGDDDRRRARPVARRPRPPGDGRALGPRPQPLAGPAPRLAGGLLRRPRGPRALRGAGARRRRGTGRDPPAGGAGRLAPGDAAAAAAAYERAIAADPGAAGPYLGLGILAAKTGNLAAARAAFDRGLARL